MTPLRTDERFRLGAEEPLGPNEHLLALNEASNELELATFSIQGLCRYSFVSRGGIEDSRFETLLERLTASAGVVARWMVVWRNERSTVHGLRPQVMRSKMEKSGWALVECAGLGVGTKPFTPGGLQLAPVEFDERIAGWAFLLERRNPLDLAASPSLWPSLQMHGLTHRLAPSREFLLQLHASDVGLAYPVTTESRAGLVVTAPRSLSSEIEGLVSAGMVERVYEGRAANRVWTD